jgi:hypothetical protein
MIDAAPEKSDQLVLLLAKHGVTFVLNEQADRILFRARLPGNVIEVGQKCLWRLWVSSFAYSCLCDEVQLARARHMSVRNLDFQSPRQREAVQMLEYAIKCDVTTRRGRAAPFDIRGLPAGLPQLFSARPSTDEETADQFYRMALGYILHHELAHICSGHDNREGVDSIIQEKEADLKAAEWLLSDPALDPKERLTRELGIACALGWLAAIDVYVPPTGNSHPPSYDRLYQIMDRYVTHKNSLVWTFLAVLLLLHLQNCDLDWGKDVRHPSWKSAVDFYVDRISRLGR